MAPVMWHKMTRLQGMRHEWNRPMMRPFIIGMGVTFVIAGMLPTWSQTQEEKEKSKYWQRVNGKFDHSHH